MSKQILYDRIDNDNDNDDDDDMDDSEKREAYFSSIAEEEEAEERWQDEQSGWY